MNYTCKAVYWNNWLIWLLHAVTAKDIIQEIGVHVAFVINEMLLFVPLEQFSSVKKKIFWFDQIIIYLIFQNENDDSKFEASSP